jgi:hypothetical protein
MSPSSFPQMAAAIFATVLATTLPTVSPAPQAAHTQAATSPRVADLQFVDAPAIPPAPSGAQLDPDTPGCAEVGLAGRLPRHRQVSTRDPATRISPPDADSAAGSVWYEPKLQVMQPGLVNPLRMAHGTRPAMHQCLVDRFDPSDTLHTRGAVYRL